MNSYKFEIPSHHRSIIKVVGVGGGGSNAVNYMHNCGIKDVEFVIVNTDVQALKSSPVPNKVQIGAALTEGLGAGANPEKGKNSAMETKEEIRRMLSENTKMIFITAGMGGGTGTGAAPVIAKIAREMDILVVGIVTAPFTFEGKKKKQQADAGIAEMKEYCDTVLVILNDKLREIYGNLSIRDAFGHADSVLLTAAKSIAEIITVTQDVNVDFEDVKTVMKNSGAAVMGSAQASGDNRARRAVEDALNSPLLNNTDINGAKKILLSISYGDQQELTMDEFSEISDYIEEKVGEGFEMIFGQGVDTALGDAVRVTVIATGFKDKDTYLPTRKVIDLDSNQQISMFQEEENRKNQEAAQHLNDQVVFSKRPENITEPVVFRREEPKDEVKETPREEKSTETSKTWFDFVADQKSPEPTQDTEKPVTTEYTFEVSRPEANDEAADERRKQIMDERQQRLKRLSINHIDANDFKNMLDVPAYLRKDVNLQDVPHSSDRKISRFNLNDDNELLGNNKFLHDNVD